MAKNVWILAEQWRGGITDITYELLSLGTDIATGLGVRLEAVLFGHNVRHMADVLGKADSVLYVDHPALAEPTAELYAEALSQLAMERKPQCILVPLTNVSLGVGTLVAERLQAPGVNFCRDVRVADGRLEAKCILYGGKMEATVIPCGEPAILGIWPGSRPGATPAPATAVEDAVVTLSGAWNASLNRYIEPEAGDVDITRQEVLVAVGRGIQVKDNLPLAEELAEALGGAVCGSRPVIDQGWLPLSRQVGKSGRITKPKLYVAVGISGAPEHVEGMKDSELIIAINSDPSAPIYGVAHYGIVGDAMEVLPALTEAVLARSA